MYPQQLCLAGIPTPPTGGPSHRVQPSSSHPKVQCTVGTSQVRPRPQTPVQTPGGPFWPKHVVMGLFGLSLCAPLLLCVFLSCCAACTHYAPLDSFRYGERTLLRLVSAAYFDFGHMTRNTNRSNSPSTRCRLRLSQCRDLLRQTLSANRAPNTPQPSYSLSHTQVRPLCPLCS